MKNNIKISAFVPIKLNSQRLPNKNFLRLGNKPLVNHILETLLDTKCIEKVFCYSSQPQIMQLLPEGVKFLARPRRMDEDEVKANELFRYAVERIEADIIVLCHATGPFISCESITKGVSAVVSGEYDCAFAVQKLQTYAWYDGKPLNYDPSDMARTQDLQAVYAETSGFYVFKRKDYLLNNTRINGKPFLVPISQKESVDIDEINDFKMALQLLHPHPEQSTFEKDHFFVNLVNSEAKHSTIEHVCFDLDGVLIDSLPVMEIAWGQVQKKFKIDIPFEVYKSHIGRPFFTIMDLLGVPDILHDEIKCCYDAATVNHQSRIKIYEQVPEALRMLKEANIKISIATSKDSIRTDAIVKHFFGDHLFDYISTPETVKTGRGKPEPDQLLAASVSLGVSPKQSLYVGDMEVDRIAANRAGFVFIHAQWGYGDITTTSDVWFQSLRDLMQFLIVKK